MALKKVTLSDSSTLPDGSNITIHYLKLFGDAGVGKKSLIHRFCSDSYTESYLMTSGGSQIVELTHDDEGQRSEFYKFNLSKVNSSEIRSMYSQGALRNTQTIFLTYDVTDQESFTHIEGWIAEINTLFGRDAVPPTIILVATKSDRIERRIVSSEDGAGMAAACGIPFIEVSSLNNDNVNELFELAIRQHQKKLKAIQKQDHLTPASKATTAPTPTKKGFLSRTLARMGIRDATTASAPGAAPTPPTRSVSQRFFSIEQMLHGAKYYLRGIEERESMLRQGREEVAGNARIASTASRTSSPPPAYDAQEPPPRYQAPPPSKPTAATGANSTGIDYSQITHNLQNPGQAVPVNTKDNVREPRDLGDEAPPRPAQPPTGWRAHPMPTAPAESSVGARSAAAAAESLAPIASASAASSSQKAAVAGPAESHRGANIPEADLLAGPQNHFYITREQKAGLYQQYRETYFQEDSLELKNNAGDATIDVRVQKLLGLQLLEYLAEQDNLIVMPIGRHFNKPILYRDPETNLVLLQSHYCSLNPESENYDNGDFSKNISRMAGVLVYDQNTHGLCWIDFNTRGSIIHHQHAALREPNAITQASHALSMLLLKESKGRVVNVAASNTKLVEATNKQELQTRRFVASIEQQIRHNDEVEFSTKLNHMGIVPILPSDAPITLSISGEKPFTLFPGMFPNDVNDERFNQALAQGRKRVTSGVDASDTEEESVEKLGFLDPISEEMMQDPVTTPNGQVYDRTSIMAWINEHHTDPYTRQPLEANYLKPNDALRQKITQWLGEHPDYGQRGPATR